MKRCLGMAAGLALAVSLPVSASTFLAMSQDEMVRQADSVVVGKVISLDSFRDATGAVIVTQAAVAVRETVVGEASGIVLVQTMGGTVDGYTVEAHGFPSFELGEQVLLFLAEDGTRIARVVGYRLGEYRIVRDAEGTEVAVPTLERGVALLTETGRPAERPRAMRLEALTRGIRASAERIERENRSAAGGAR